MKKDDELLLTIQNIGYNGEGISKDFGIPIFVPLALANEKVLARLTFVKKNFANAKLLKVVEPSSERTKPPCKYFERCGGCCLQHMNYDNQLYFKAGLVEDCFKKIAQMNIQVPLTIASPKQYEYRNKFSVPVRSNSGEIQIGFFAENSHRIIPIDKCLLQEDWANELVKVVKEWLKKENVSAFNEETNTGLVKHLVARKFENQIMVVLVINGKSLPKKEKLLEKLKLKPEICSVYINENTTNNNVIFGEKFTCIFGSEEITAKIGELLVNVVPQSFMQVNNEVRDLLYSAVSKEVSTNADVIIDAYSGAGTLTTMVAKHNPKCNIFGIEIVPEAVVAANDLAKNNNVSNIQNITGDCETELPILINKHAGQNICLILDPPRKGCGKQILETAVNCKVQKIIYVSCDPATLARDVKVILDTAKSTNQSYELVFLQPYDMFPQTKHVETLACLTRNKL